MEELIATENKKELPKPDPLPSFDDKFKSIHEHITKADPEKEWPVIREWIKRKPLNLQDAIDMLSEQPDMAMRAQRLFLLAKRELERFELEWKDKTSALRQAARDNLEQNKKDKKLAKQITNDMVDDWIIEQYGEIWIEMYTRLRDMKNTTKHLEMLADRVAYRDADLRRFIEKFQPHANEPAWMQKGQQRKARRS